MALRVADVHASQVGGEQCRLLTTFTGLHLEQDVVGVVGVARREQVGQLGVEFVGLGGEFVDLGGEGFVVDGEFPGRLQVTAGGFELAVGGDDRSQLGEPPPDLPGPGGVGVQLGIGQLAFEVGVFGEQCFYCLLYTSDAADE